MWFQWTLHKWDNYVVIYSRSVYKSLTNKAHMPASAGKHETNSFAVSKSGIHTISVPL